MLLAHHPNTSKRSFFRLMNEQSLTGHSPCHYVTYYYSVHLGSGLCPQQPPCGYSQRYTAKITFANFSRCACCVHVRTYMHACICICIYIGPVIHCILQMHGGEQLTAPTNQPTLQKDTFLHTHLTSPLSSSHDDYHHQRHQK